MKIHTSCGQVRTSIANNFEGIAKAFYSSRPGSARDFTHVRLIFMNDSFIKCVSSILKYWRNILFTEENETINQPHSVVHPGLCCRWPWQRSRCRDSTIDSTACRKFVANPSKSEFHILYFIKINYDVFKIMIYILFK